MTDQVSPLRELRAVSKLKKMRMPTAIPKGNKLYKLDTRVRSISEGPGEPPPEFVGAQTSADEWYFYWALATIKDDPVNPREPPFLGGRDWVYQGHDPTMAASLAITGAAIDFIVHHEGRSIAIRIQSELHHVMATSEQIARDLYYKTHFSAFSDVVDVYSQWFIGDPTGQAACATARRALAGEEAANPLTFGLGQRVRMLRDQ